MVMPFTIDVTATPDATDVTFAVVLNNGTVNPANQLVPNPLQPKTGPLLAFTGTIGQATVPQNLLYLPYQYLFGGQIDDSRGFGDFHSMQLRLSHAFANGFQMLVNYTWSKELDYTSTATEDGQGYNRGGSGGSHAIEGYYST